MPVHPFIVVDAICEIAALLNLNDKRTGTQRMYQPRLYEEDIITYDWNALEELVHITCVE